MCWHFSCLGMPREAPIFPFDWHTHHPGLSDQQRSPFGSWKVWNGTLLPELPSSCLCCWDWFNRQRQLTEGVTPTGYSPHTHTHTACDTEPKLHPFYADTHSPVWLQSPHPSHFSLSTSLTSAGSAPHSWITLIHHRRTTVCLQSSTKLHKQRQHGEQHVMYPPAQLKILQQEFHTQKQVRTTKLSRYSYCTCISVFAPHRAHVMPAVVCYFRLCVSDGRSLWYFTQFLSSGVKQRLWILRGQGQDHMVIQDSSRVVSEWCPSGQRCQWSSYHLPPLCISVKMICQLSVNLVSLQNQDLTPIHYHDNMWAIIVNYR